MIPSRERTLDEVRDDVVAAWKQDQLAKRLNDTAAELLAKAEGGTPLEDLATEAGLEVRTATDLQRNAPSEDLGREAISAVFSGPVGTVATAPAADQGRLVLKVTGATVPEFDLSAPEVAAIGDQVSQQLQDTLIGQFVSDQEDKAGVEVNNAAIARIVGLEQN
ncbi:peptidylprolyl isomerase [Roseibium salinum]|nr:peptidylprolyl isomerase [Roseibium salinum]